MLCALWKLRARSPEVGPALTALLTGDDAVLRRDTLRTVLNSCDFNEHPDREKLLNTLAGAGVPDLIRNLTVFLQGEDTGLAGRAAEALAELGPRASVAASALLAALRHQTADVRVKAALALGRAGAGPEVLAPLADLGLCEGQSGRRAAFEALSRLAPDTFPVLILEGLRRRPDTKMADGLALEFVTPLHWQAVPILSAALADPEPGPRHWAVHCLRKIGHSAAPAVPLLQQLRDNDPQALTRSEAARALAAIEAELAAACRSSRPVPFDPRWRTATVLDIARQVVLQGEFARMSALADALEQAGCADEE
jgi:HEAT repeat protein